MYVLPASLRLGLCALLVESFSFFRTGGYARVDVTREVRRDKLVGSKVVGDNGTVPCGNSSFGLKCTP